MNIFPFMPWKLLNTTKAMQPHAPTTSTGLKCCYVPSRPRAWELRSHARPLLAGRCPKASSHHFGNFPTQHLGVLRTVAMEEVLRFSRYVSCVLVTIHVLSWLWVGTLRFCLCVHGLRWRYLLCPVSWVRVHEWFSVSNVPCFKSFEGFPHNLNRSIFFS